MGDLIRVLIVDAFRTDDTGRKKSKAFLRLVRDSLRTVSLEASFRLDIRGSAELAELVFDRLQSEAKNLEVRNTSNIVQAAKLGPFRRFTYVSYAVFVCPEQNREPCSKPLCSVGVLYARNRLKHAPAHRQRYSLGPPCSNFIPTRPASGPPGENASAAASAAGTPAIRGGGPGVCGRRRPAAVEPGRRPPPGAGEPVRRRRHAPPRRRGAR